MGKLDEFDSASSAYVANRLLSLWLGDDELRSELYAEMRQERRPTLKFKSLAYRAQGEASDVYLVTAPSDIQAALQQQSVKPYAALGGGRFMLAIDDHAEHGKQRGFASQTFDFKNEEIDRCAAEAFARGSLLALKKHEFDLASLSEEVALRFVEELYGIPDLSHVLLLRTNRRLYEELCFQILGRHFAYEPLPPRPTAEPPTLRDVIAAAIESPADRDTKQRHRNFVLRADETVFGRMQKTPNGFAKDDLVIIAIGMLTGTIGNVQAAVCIAIDHFFRPDDRRCRPIDAACEAARQGDDKTLAQQIMEALKRNPPAAFLPRCVGKGGLPLKVGGTEVSLPAGTDLVLAIGAAESCELVFGGDTYGKYVHQCVGERIARRLIVNTVKQVLLLPGLAQVIDTVGGEPKPLTKRYGMICNSYPMQYNRMQKLCQQKLAVVMKIKAPVAENAMKLGAVIAAGAPAIEEALSNSGHVHFAFFILLEGGTKLGLFTIYDGDFDAYIEHFALGVSLFDKLFDYVEDAPPTPVRLFPKEFVAKIRQYDQRSFGDYFFSAYPQTSVARVKNLLTRG